MSSYHYFQFFYLHTYKILLLSARFQVHHTAVQKKIFHYTY